MSYGGERDLGQLLIWESTGSSDGDGVVWVADGQQRLTSLCLLLGARPPWWQKREIDRCNLSRRFDLRLDIEASVPPLFHCSFDGEIDDSSGRLIRVSEILAHDAASAAGAAALRAMAVQIKRRGLCRSVEEDHLYRVIHRVAMIRQLPLCTTRVGCNLEDLLEIFQRLNSRGSRFRRLLLNLAMRSWVSASRAGFSVFGPRVAG